ncbi:MAG: C69 family dipeptidase [Thermoprotei archaeon]
MFVVLPQLAEGGATVFGKNSDREPNEAQVVEYHPHRRRTKPTVECTYVEVPEVEEAYAILISRPYWMFGAEMGVNEYGVSIGNTAVFTNQKPSKRGLLGMDMLRLALERSRDAETALRVITGLLEEYGQGGSNSAVREWFYDNAFLIADREAAWVLETAGRFWVAKQVRDHYSISNMLTIHSDYDLASQGLEEEAKRRGFMDHSSKLDFARAFQAKVYTWFTHAAQRVACTRSLLGTRERRFKLHDAKAILRSHEGTGRGYGAGSARNVCMHAGGTLAPDQTASSMITTFVESKPVAFITGSSLPCVSVFKPHIVAGAQPVAYTTASFRYDAQSYWWALERRHRQGDHATLTAWALRLEAECERGFLERLHGENKPEEIAQYTKDCYNTELSTIPAGPSGTPSRFWRKLNTQAAIPT